MSQRTGRPSSERTGRPSGSRPIGRWRLALIALGALSIGYGGVGLLTAPDSRPVGQLLFLAGVLLAHDALLMPLVLLVGAMIGRFLPPLARPAARVAGLVSLAVGVVALPLVLGHGRRADDPSALPLAYGRGLALVLLGVWAAALVSVAVRKQAERRARAGRRRSRR